MAGTLLTATDLVCWAKLLGFTDTPSLAHAEIATFGNLVLHVAARITHSARQVQVRIDHTWKSVHDPATGTGVLLRVAQCAVVGALAT